MTANPRFGGAMDAQIRNKAFELAKPAEGKFSAASTALQSGDAALVILNKVTEVPATTEPAVEELQGYASQLSQSNYEVVRKALRENADIVKHNIDAAVQNDLRRMVSSHDAFLFEIRRCICCSLKLSLAFCSTQSILSAFAAFYIAEAASVSAGNRHASQ
ncbi:MAG: hypothetical protein U5L01_04575 [Rheinheimera sp.]|nr:hypothetical protein [Rheinheimera sp.]